MSVEAITEAILDYMFEKINVSEEQKKRLPQKWKKRPTKKPVGKSAKFQNGLQQIRALNWSRQHEYFSQRKEMRKMRESRPPRKMLSIR